MPERAAGVGCYRLYFSGVGGGVVDEEPAYEVDHEEHLLDDDRPYHDDHDDHDVHAAAEQEDQFYDEHDTARTSRSA